MAAGLGANVVIMDINLERLRYLDDVMPANVHAIFSDAHTVREHLLLADLVIGAVLIPGATAPRLVTRQDLKAMKNGSVIVDVAIDQGGCVETSRPTTHQHPTFVVEGVVHYCVTNMPGAVGRTSTIALCNATLPYALKIANKGFERAAAEDPGLADGINLVAGRVSNRAVAESLGFSYEPVRRAPAQHEPLEKICLCRVPIGCNSSAKCWSASRMITFLVYGLALEHKKAGNASEAISLLDRVVALDPGYCYAYHQKGLDLRIGRARPKMPARLTVTGSPPRAEKGTNTPPRKLKRR